MPLCKSISPEEKRHIIGDTFMRVCDRVVREMSLDYENLFLAQGTLRPDLIESGSHIASEKADTIKTHHNDTGVVRQLRANGKIIEPLKDYHKDEVRELGKRFGLPDSLIMRQPFPGPGLAIRILCCEEDYRDKFYDEMKSIVGKILNGESFPCYRNSCQLKGSVLPIRTVGVQGDGRTYSYAVAVTTAMNHLNFNREDWEEVLQVGKLIPKLAHKVNRVVFMFGGPLMNQECRVTKTLLTQNTISRIREADSIVTQELVRHNLIRKLSQVPVILAPLGFEKKDAHSIVVRTFITDDFMTGVPATPGSDYLPLEALYNIVNRLLDLPFVGRVMYDLTPKPPGTTEWE
jgi:GMP synthase (glutamine-hydrolysing)